MQSKGQTFNFRGRTWTTGDVHFPYYPAWSDGGDCLMIAFERSPEINGKRMPSLYQEEFDNLFVAIEGDPHALAIFDKALYGPNNPKPDPFPLLDWVSSNNVSFLLGLVRSSRAINARDFVHNLTATINAYNANRHALLVLREATARKILNEVEVSRVLLDEHASLEDLRESLEQLREELRDAEDIEIVD
jgi:hypothetical protein